MATAHESESQDPNATAMDLHNNTFGRLTEALNPDATEEELLEILRKERYMQIDSGTDIPEDYIGLVYFINESPMDGRFSGMLTNPDVDVVWNSYFDFTQCNTEIRGQYLAEREAAHAIRRFEGVWIDGEMNLEVDYPYSFEIEENHVPCENILISLKGDISALSGFWTSSNCELGGEVNISR